MLRILKLAGKPHASERAAVDVYRHLTVFTGKCKVRPLILIIFQINAEAQISDLRTVDPQVSLAGINFEVPLRFVALCQQHIETAQRAGLDPERDCRALQAEIRAL